MKIRCGSHQQNRSIVRPGLSLMAAKVALTAEEFRENSQRSIALFNTEKLSTNSTHVLKSAYCNSVHFCRCNLHGACGGKGEIGENGSGASGLQSARSVWRQRPVLTKGEYYADCCNLHGACGGKAIGLYSAVSVAGCNLHGACGGKDCSSDNKGQRSAGCNLHGACGGKEERAVFEFRAIRVAICTERVEAKLIGNRQRPL